MIDSSVKSFKEIKKNCKLSVEGMAAYKLAVLGDCATQHLSQAIKGYAYEYSIAVNIFDADYNQIMAQIMDDASELYTFAPEAVLIDMCSEKLYDAFREYDAENSKLDFADYKISEIIGYWDILSKKGLKILQFNFPEIDDRLYGNYGAVNEKSFIFQLRKLNLLLGQKALEKGNVYIVDISYIQNLLGRKMFSDSKLYFSAKMPYSLDSLPFIGKEVSIIINSLLARIKKCVILDLDNTLWGGVIGDDGLNGIQIGELGVGHAFQAFQEWLLELKKTGIILCVCSKNDDDKAREPFEKHPEMVLHLSDIALFTANWQDKATNIIEMAKTLNLNTDSFVFIDDNPFERDQVRTMVPGITVPELPSDPALYLEFLKEQNLFERISVSAADKDRTRQYQEEAGRKTLESSFQSYDDYLKALEMKATVNSFDEFNYPRIAQLSQRSNQFNLRTVRYTEDDVRKLSENPDYITLDFSLKDKFGDHGLISVMVIKKDGNAAFIENWFMSCRVLKRGMEEFIINTLYQKAKEAGLSYVTGEYIKTAKNNMVKDIYEKMGFERISDTEFKMNLESFKLQKSYIE